MKEQLKQRLQDLEAEFEKGQQMLVDIDQRREELHATLLRISGATLVLKEELAKGAESSPEGEQGAE